MLTHFRNFELVIFQLLNRAGMNGGVDSFSFILESFISSGVILFVALAFFLSKKNRNRLTGLVLIASLALGYYASYFFKHIVRRQRPHDLVWLNLRYVETGFSFPSTHTTMAFAFAAVLAYVYPKHRVFYYLFALCIGLSRIYDGVHYPFDVVAGILLGVCVGKGLCMTAKTLYEMRIKAKGV